MTYHALVIDDSPDILDDVKDRLESLGHTSDRASSQEDARKLLVRNSYSYILLDLEIPVRYGRPSRLTNGQNLLREIRETKGHEQTPIIVMTSHGHDGPDLAVEVLRGNGAVDFVKKPFPTSGHTLEKVVQDALRASGLSRPGARKRSGPQHEDPTLVFESGEMVFFEERVELCQVRICGGPGSGLARRVLEELKQKKPNGKFVAYSGNELAKRVGCSGGQNGVAGAIRELRKKIAEALLEEANVECGPRDVITSGGAGYRLTDKIMVRDADDPVNEPNDPANDPERHRDDPVNDPVNGPVNGPVNDSDDPQLNERQRWVIEQLRAGAHLKMGDVMAKHRCSKTTAKRDLTALRDRGLIEFDGAPKTGHWRLS